MELTLNRVLVSGPALNTGGSNCAWAEAARQAVARKAIEDLKIDILAKFLLREMMACRRSARFTDMSGVCRTVVWSTRAPKSRGDCQTFIKSKGCAVGPHNKKHPASFSTIAGELTLKWGWLVVMTQSLDRTRPGRTRRGR